MIVSCLMGRRFVPTDRLQLLMVKYKYENDSREAMREGIVKEMDNPPLIVFPDEVRFNTSLREGFDGSKSLWFRLPVDDMASQIQTFVLPVPVQKQGSRGIITCAGELNMLSVIIPVIEFQKGHLGCRLPVHVFYVGREEFSDDVRKRLDGINGVSYSDISAMIDIDVGDLRHYRVKGFALSMSPFKETIFIDSDFWAPFRSLDVLFDDEDYQRTGALFFYDRFFHEPRFSVRFQRVFLRHFIGSNCTGDASFCETSCILNGFCPHDQHSAVMAVKTDWSRREMEEYAKYLVLLSHPKSVLHKSLYSWVYYDKESFWVARELARLSYHFHGKRSALIGSKTKGWRDCLEGVMLLTMYKDRPLGFNKKGGSLSMYPRQFTHWNPGQARGIYVRNLQFESFQCTSDGAIPFIGKERESILILFKEAFSYSQTLWTSFIPKTFANLTIEKQ